MIDGLQPDNMAMLHKSRSGMDGIITKPWRQPALVSLSILALSLALWFLPGRAEIPPLVQSDYAYQLTAADRMMAGHGLTVTKPVAPLQPWEWSSDWVFLTKWPIGYSLLVAGTSRFMGVSSLQASAIMNVLFCAAAMVGWFLLLKKIFPAGITSTLLAGLAAASSVSIPMLINPSTDIILIAALPYLIGFAWRLIESDCDESSCTSKPIAWRGFVILGLMSGALVWIRYAGVFVPIVLGSFMLVMWLLRSVQFRQVIGFTMGASLPIVTLLLINRAYGSSESLQSQLNLGHAISLNFSPALFVQAWYNFTDLGFYDYHSFTKQVYAFWPGVMLAAIFLTPWGKRGRTYFSSPPIILASTIMIVWLLLLITASVIFGDKFAYVSLPRYYAPIKPLYYLLFVAPILLIPLRAIRLPMTLALLVCASWVVNQEWHRPYTKLRQSPRQVSAYGQWSQAFTPQANELFGWLQTQDRDPLIIISNYHEYITLETQIPALPIPPDESTLARWVKKICASRGIENPQVLFVLDPDNRYRDYWIPEPKEIVNQFRLVQNTPTNFSAMIWTHSSS